MYTKPLTNVNKQLTMVWYGFNNFSFWTKIVFQALCVTKKSKCLSYYICIPKQNVWQNEFMLLLEIERDAFFCLIFCSFILCQQALMFCHSLSQQMKAIMPRSIIKMVLLQVIAVHIFHIYFLWSGPTPDMKADLSSFYHLSSI